MNNIEIDTAFLEQLSYLERDMEVATQRTIKRITQWLRSEMVKHFAQQLDIKVSVSRRRVKAYSKGSQGKLWIGIGLMHYHHLGDLQQDEKGVQAQGEHLPHAFIDPMRSSQLLVWRRSQKARLPIEPVKKDISTQAKQLLKRYSPTINKKFRALFDEEIERAITRLL